MKLEKTCAWELLSARVGWGLRTPRAGGFDERGSRVLGPRPASQQDLLVSVIIGNWSRSSSCAARPSVLSS